MKKIVLPTVLALCVFSLRAQRFFYITPGSTAGKPIADRLLSASQFVTPSALTSDYTIKTDIAFKKETNSTVLKILVEDSVDFRPVYQVVEEYRFGPAMANENLLRALAMKTLIEKNIGQIIFYAACDHRNTFRRMND